MSDTTAEAAAAPGLRPCKECSCPNFILGIHGRDCAPCSHPPEVHGAPIKPGVNTSVLKPVSVRNTGNHILVFVADDPQHTFKLAPGIVKVLTPENYRVQVDFTKPPIVIVIAKIVYDPKLKRFDIQAEDGLPGATFVTNIDLEAVGPQAC